MYLYSDADNYKNAAANEPLKLYTNDRARIKQWLLRKPQQIYQSNEDNEDNPYSQNRKGVDKTDLNVQLEKTSESKMIYQRQRIWSCIVKIEALRSWTTSNKLLEMREVL